MLHYYVIAEAAEHGWFLTFPNGGTGYSFAETAYRIVPEARDLLASTAMAGDQLPHSIEDGAQPPSEDDLLNFNRPMVVVVPFALVITAAAA